MKEFPMYASMPKDQPTFRVAGILALTVAALLPIIVHIMPPRPNPQDFDTPLGYFILWLGLWLTAWGFAVLATAIRYVWMYPPRPATYSGLGSGLAMVAIFTVSLLVRYFGLVR